MITEKITELFTRKVGIESIGIFLAAVFLCLVILRFFIFIVKTCFSLERQSGKASHTLLKTILIAIVPTLYGIADTLSFSDAIPQKIIIPACAVFCIIVALWNVFTYGLIGGALFTVIHIVFGLLASLGISALIFIGFALVVLYLFSAQPKPSATGSAPSLVRDVSNGQTYYVYKGLNGELYVQDHGRDSVLYPTDYAGEYIDNSGNRYK